MKPRAVLIYAPSWIGDGVMSLAAVRAVRESFPDARLAVLTRPWVEAVYQAVDAIDEIVRYDPRQDDRGWSGFWRTARRVREGKFDLCVLLPNAFRAAALIKASGVKERWGFATEGRGFFLTRQVPQPPRPFGRHQAYFYLDLVAGLGLDVPDGAPDTHLDVASEVADGARRVLEQAGWTGGALVGVHPGATNSRAKIWSASRYAEVATRMAAERDAQVAVFGGPKEAELAAEVLAALSGPAKETAIALQGKTSLSELMGALKFLTVFLTNDSGPMHLAAALGVSTVAVFGPTDARETGPLGPKTTVVREPVDCSPCLYRDCPIDHRCMERVSVERVLGEANALVPTVL